MQHCAHQFILFRFQRPATSQFLHLVIFKQYRRQSIRIVIILFVPGDIRQQPVRSEWQQGRFPKCLRFTSQ